ncbi:sortase [Nocardioides panacihumi]|uniref:Sortase n=1 Tax=Nocardioides panacihumi TaxID=400774 RepID=A0ABN2RI51_9ACTN
MSDHASSDWSTAPAKAGAVLRRTTTAVRARLAQASRRTRDRLGVVDTSAPADLRRAVPLPSESTMLRVSGWAMMLFVVLLAGFVAHLTLMSHLAEERSQRLLYGQFRSELAAGTAPVGQVGVDGALLAPGSPVALVRIPALGLSQTVVEGTSSRALLDGPGHRRDTPLPGQQGASVVYGRQAAYGGPFRAIDTLVPGDRITTVTGQGTATYEVTAIRHAGDQVAALPSAKAGRLTLVTSSGSLFSGGHVVRVDADLVGTAQPAPQPVLRLGSLSTAEDPLGTDPSGWLPLFLLLELAIVVGVGLVWSLRRWGRWHTWIVAVPVVLALGAQIAEQAVVVLPNLY